MNCDICDKEISMGYAYKVGRIDVLMCKECSDKRLSQFPPRCYLCKKKLRKNSVYPINENGKLYMLCKNCYRAYNKSRSINNSEGEPPLFTAPQSGSD